MRDFYWRRDGWRWVVATVEQGDGNLWVNEVVLLRFWLERSAARACSVIFQSYLDGQDVQRDRHSRAPGSSPKGTPQ